MAQRRMFSKSITDSDKFTEMPPDAQSLYFHLGMHADDEGFVTPKGIMRMINAGDDALRVLNAKGFTIPFETGVIVIRHWKEHNYIPKDRFKGTKFLYEKSNLLLTQAGDYSHKDEYDPNSEEDDRIAIPCIHNVDKMDTQVRLGKVSIRENGSSSKKKPYYDGCEMRSSKGKRWVIPKDGSPWLEFAGSDKDIIWK